MNVIPVIVFREKKINHRKTISNVQSADSAYDFFKI